MTISYRWERSCGKWNQPSDNPFRTISFDEVRELNEIFFELLDQNKKNNIRSNRSELQKKTIEDWANSKKISIRYYWGCIGKSSTAHKVKCLTVTKDKQLYILRATAICGSDISSATDEEMQCLTKRGVYLIHKNKLDALHKCKRCTNT